MPPTTLWPMAAYYATLRSTINLLPVALVHRVRIYMACCSRPMAHSMSPATSMQANSIGYHQPQYQVFAKQATTVTPHHIAYVSTPYAADSTAYQLHRHTYAGYSSNLICCTYTNLWYLDPLAVDLSMLPTMVPLYLLHRPGVILWDGSPSMVNCLDLLYCW